MRIYLGIDGGQSSTTALIGDETGRVLGEGNSGPCNHVAEPQRRSKFLSAIGDSVREAARQAGVAEEFTAACAGFSGGSADKDTLTRECIHAARYLITDDAYIALTGATNGAPGIVVIAGTGSIAYGRNASGEAARVGGWGYIFGDEGGAFDLVRQGLRAALRHEERWGPPTTLREHFLAKTAAMTMNDLLHQFYTTDYPRESVAKLAPIIDLGAAEGDAVAITILNSAAQALATTAAAVRRQLFADTDSIGVYYIGGVFQSERLLAQFRLLTELDGFTKVQPPRNSPVHGALTEALRLGC